jgi:predicted PurR-regulated permease PerM
MRSAELSTRTIVRAVVLAVAVLLGLYVIYVLRRPITWIVVAIFIAVTLSGPVNVLARRMKRGLALAIVYVGVILVPFGLGAIVVPPLVRQGNQLVQDVPRYARDLSNFVNRNRRLRQLEANYNITERLQSSANRLSGKIGTAAGTLRDVGIGLVNSIFALVTILILSIFLVKDGRRWVNRAVARQAPDRAARLTRTVDRIAQAIGNYVGGALAQATVAGITTFIVLKILGVPFAAPLAVLTFFFDLIPLVGATIGAVLVGIVTLFNDFPTATIVWTIWAIVYQQIENTVIQPQIQRRAVDVHPFAVLVSVLFGSTLFGILGALLAIPVAASLQIVLREYGALRREIRAPRPEPRAGGEAAEAPA